MTTQPGNKAIGRLTDAVLRAIETPSAILRRQPEPDEGPIQYAGAAIVCAVLVEVTAEKVMGDLDNWQPTGFLNLGSGITDGEARGALGITEPGAST